LDGGLENLTAASRNFAREIGSLDAIFAFLSEFTGDLPVDEATSFRINLVVEELFTNQVRHNEGGIETITLNLDREDNRLRIELIDDDVEPFDPDTVTEVDVNAGIDERKPGGLGIHFVRSMVDSLDYDYEPESRRMRISVIKTLE
jgi:anti-sigma regulatory factor (Ser/Thr protein kinase)